GPPRGSPDGLHGLDGLDPEPRRDAVLHRGDPASHPADGARRYVDSRRSRPSCRAGRVGRAAARGDRDGYRRRRATIHGALRRLPATPTHRWWHAAEDLRSHGDGIARRIDACWRRGPAGDGGTGNRDGRLAGGFRGCRGRIADQRGESASPGSGGVPHGQGTGWLGPRSRPVRRNLRACSGRRRCGGVAAMTRTLGVFGLGYVGCVSAACFAKAGWRVIGVDVNEMKVDMINQGRSPVLEPGLADLVRDGVANGCLRATTAPEEAVEEAALSLICVGTPSGSNGTLDLTYITRVCEDIGRALREREQPHVVVVRSTVLPGTVAKVVTPTLERAARRRVGQTFAVCVNPEFLREGTSLQDFYHPTFTLIGGDDRSAACT